MRNTKAPLCVVTLDFTAAFDNISHEYLFAILKMYGFSEQVQQRIRNLYTNIPQWSRLMDICRNRYPYNAP
jgi:hypothetical protein